MALIGLEKELLLTNPDGSVAHEADTVLQRLKGAFVAESTLSVVETNPLPEPSIAALDRTVRQHLATLDEAAATEGLHVVPSSLLGPGEPRVRREGRYAATARVLGEGIADYDAGLGLHIHLDRHPRLVDQYNLLISLDPLFALLASTPYLRGENTVNDRRVLAQRLAFAAHPEVGALPPYARSASEIEDRTLRGYEEWISHVPPSERSYYTPESTNWGPVRVHARTLEVRSGDTSTHARTMAHAACYFGIAEAVLGDREVREARRGDPAYGITEDALIIPSRGVLSALEAAAIRHGVQHAGVRNYLHHLVDVAASGLSEQDRSYLAPYEETLTERENFADTLSKVVYARQDRPDTLDAATAHYLYRLIAATDAQERAIPLTEARPLSR